MSWTEQWARSPQMSWPSPSGAPPCVTFCGKGQSRRQVELKVLIPMTLKWRDEPELSSWAPSTPECPEEVGDGGEGRGQSDCVVRKTFLTFAGLQSNGGRPQAKFSTASKSRDPTGPSEGPAAGRHADFKLRADPQTCPWVYVPESGKARESGNEVPGDPRPPNTGCLERTSRGQGEDIPGTFTTCKA